MNSVSRSLLVGLCLAVLAGPVFGQPRPKAYAPEDLGRLSLPDQERVIRLEYEEQSGGQDIPDDQLRFYLDQVNRSDWGFSRIRSDITQSLGTGGVGAPPAGGTIRCESNDNRRRDCTTPWRGHSRLVNQLSGASCIQNQSWSTANGQVTVWNGCRAQFAQAWSDGGGGIPESGGSIRCESQGSRSRSCATPWRGPSRVSRQMSDTRCLEGQNWSSRDGEVTVWGGCRAEFSSRWNDDTAPDYGSTVRCESTNNRARTCDVPWRGATRVVRQLSDTACTQGHTWESSSGRVTVMRGCRAEFGPGGSEWPGNARTVTCSSDNQRYTTCHWPPGQGQPRVIRQLSREPCTQGRSWGMRSHNTIWVSQGCRAVFGD